MTDVALELDRNPRSGGAARAFVRHHLFAAGLPELVETAELVVTELVTNVIVHTLERPVVRLAVDGDAVRVAVEDDCPAPPVGGVLDAGAVSGRGLLLVDGLVPSWGVSRTSGGGKAVWFELVRSVCCEPDVDVDRLLDLWAEEFEPVRDGLGAAGRSGGGGPTTTRVHLAGVSPALLHDTKAHLDDLVRDLTLVREGALGGTPQDPELDELAVRLTALVGQLVGFRNEMRRQALAASRRGAETFTLEMELPVDLADRLADYRRALDEADELCAAGRLLLAPARPEVVAFRRRKLDTFVRQLTTSARVRA